MSQSCAYCGRFKTNDSEYFHKFPLKDEELLKTWLENMRMQKRFTPTNTSYLCSDHFEEECFSKIDRKLLSGSIPTRFGAFRPSCVYCREIKGPETSKPFIRFPLYNPELLEKWVDAMNLKDVSITNKTFLCGDHFENHCFMKLKKDEKFTLLPLKYDAVPSIFTKSEVLRAPSTLNKSQNVNSNGLKKKGRPPSLFRKYDAVPRVSSKSEDEESSLSSPKPDDVSKNIFPNSEVLSAPSTLNKSQSDGVKKRGRPRSLSRKRNTVPKISSKSEGEESYPLSHKPDAASSIFSNSEVLTAPSTLNKSQNTNRDGVRKRGRPRSLSCKRNVVPRLSSKSEGEESSLSSHKPDDVSYMFPHNEVLRAPSTYNTSLNVDSNGLKKRGRHRSLSRKSDAAPSISSNSEVIRARSTSNTSSNVDSNSLKKRGRPRSLSRKSDAALSISSNSEVLSALSTSNTSANIDSNGLKKRGRPRSLSRKSDPVPSISTKSEGKESSLLSHKPNAELRIFLNREELRSFSTLNKPQKINPIGMKKRGRPFSLNRKSDPVPGIPSNSEVLKSPTTLNKSQNVNPNDIKKRGRPFSLPRKSDAVLRICLNREVLRSPTTLKKSQNVNPNGIKKRGRPFSLPRKSDAVLRICLNREVLRSPSTLNKPQNINPNGVRKRGRPFSLSRKSDGAPRISSKSEGEESSILSHKPDDVSKNIILNNEVLRAPSTLNKSRDINPNGIRKRGRPFSLSRKSGAVPNISSNREVGKSSRSFRKSDPLPSVSSNSEEKKSSRLSRKSDAVSRTFSNNESNKPSLLSHEPDAVPTTFNDNDDKESSPLSHKPDDVTSNSPNSEGDETIKSNDSCFRITVTHFMTKESPSDASSTSKSPANESSKKPNFSNRTIPFEPKKDKALGSESNSSKQLNFSSGTILHEPEKEKLLGSESNSSKQQNLSSGTILLESEKEKKLGPVITSSEQPNFLSGLIPLESKKQKTLGSEINKQSNFLTGAILLDSKKEQALGPGINSSKQPNFSNVAVLLESKKEQALGSGIKIKPNLLSGAIPLESKKEKTLGPEMNSSKQPNLSNVAILLESKKEQAFGSGFNIQPNFLSKTKPLESKKEKLLGPRMNSSKQPNFSHRIIIPEPTKEKVLGPEIKRFRQLTFSNGTILLEAEKEVTPGAGIKRALLKNLNESSDSDIPIEEGFGRTINGKLPMDSDLSLQADLNSDNSLEYEKRKTHENGDFDEMPSTSSASLLQPLENVTSKTVGETPQAKKWRQILHDHYNQDSSSALDPNLDTSINVITTLKNESRIQKQQIMRLNKRVATLTQIVCQLRKKLKIPQSGQ